MAQDRVKRRTFMIALLNTRAKKMSLDEYEQRKEEPALQRKLDIINTVHYFAWL